MLMLGENDSYRELTQSVLARHASRYGHSRSREGSLSSVPSLPSTPESSPVCHRLGCSPLPSLLLERNPATGALLVAWGHHDGLIETDSTETDCDSSKSSEPDEEAMHNEQKQVQATLEALATLRTASTRLGNLSKRREETVDAHEPTDSEISTTTTEPGPYRPYGAVHNWEVLRRREHSNRLQQAAAKASKGAARKMLALAANEQKRASALPERLQTVDLADLHLDAYTEMFHDETRVVAKEQPAWTCFVVGVHALLGCDGSFTAHAAAERRTMSL
jgi:hypothetical protein